jgi:hypothetical protein
LWGCVRLEYVRDRADGRIAIVWLVGEWGGRDPVLERAYECFGGFDGYFGRCGKKHFSFLGKEFNSVCDPFGACFVDKDAVTVIVFGRWSQVPSIDVMRIPSSSLVWFFVDYNFGARWCHGCSVVVKCSVEHLVGGHGRIVSCRS